MMWKRLLSLMTAAVILTALAACGGDPAQPATAAPTDAPTQAASDGTEPDEPIDLAAFIRSFRRDAQIEPQIIHDADGVTVTAESIRYDAITGAAILLRAHNTTRRDLLVQMDSAVVNGYMMQFEFSLDVGAGDEAEGEVLIPYTALALAGQSVIAEAELSLQLVDRRSYEVLAMCAPAVILTTAAADYEPSYDDGGQLVWDDQGIRIVLKGLDTGRRIADSIVLKVYLYNGYERAVSIQTASVTVNGYEMTSAMTTTVLPGRHAVDAVAFFDPDLEEHDIQTIDSVEISFKIFDEETWAVIAESEKISAELS